MLGLVSPVVSAAASLWGFCPLEGRRTEENSSPVYLEEQQHTVFTMFTVSKKQDM